MYVKTLNYQLNNGWLDKRTRRLVVEFTTYSPHMDVITVFIFKFETALGLIYDVKYMVCRINKNGLLLIIITVPCMAKYLGI